MRKFKFKKGFTLAELLVVVAIIAVLVAVAIPIFTSQLEKSREAVDMANIRSAYAQVMADAVSDGQDHKSAAIALKQQRDGWQNASGAASLHGIATRTVGAPRANGKAYVEFIANLSEVVIHYGVPVPGDQAAVDALSFPEGSDARIILLSLPDAERKALEEYEKSGETKAVGYLVNLNPDGSFTLTPRKDAQSFHEKNPWTIMGNNQYVPGGYMVAVMDGKVGSNLKYDPSSNTLKSTPYHIRNDKNTNYAEGINFDY